MELFTKLNSSSSSSSNSNVTRIGDSILVINNFLPDKKYKDLEAEYISLKDIFLHSTQNHNQKHNQKHHTKYSLMMSNYEYKITFKYANANKLLSPLWNDFINNYFKEINNIELIYKTPNFYLNTNTNTNANNQLMKEIDNDILGWFFMKNDLDKSIGGNFEIFNKKNERIISVPYQQNTLILINNINKLKENKKIEFEYRICERSFCLHSMRYIRFSS
jgi:hypothetical protein